MIFVNSAICKYNPRADENVARAEQEFVLVLPLAVLEECFFTFSDTAVTNIQANTIFGNTTIFPKTLIKGIHSVKTQLNIHLY